MPERHHKCHVPNHLPLQGGGRHRQVPGGGRACRQTCPKGLIPLLFSAALRLPTPSPTLPLSGGGGAGADADRCPSRRRFCAGLAGLALAAPLLAACGRKEGPEPIRYDRDACEICNMIISDPRFAAEIRDPDGKIHKFDDIGDAIHWMENQPWFKQGQKPKEFWVMNFRDGKTWLDARKAFYLPGQHSPMDYGFGAVPAQEPGTVSYAEMYRKVLEKGIHSRCIVPQAG